MKIHIKRIEHERIEDAPFIGAMICAIDCNINCEGCFNKHLKEDRIKEIECLDLINEIKSNPFNQGIILSGLEWTLQPEELREIIKLAIQEKLKIILYTGLTEEEFKKDFYDILKSNIYIKFGRYIKELENKLDKETNVLLSSNNQKIIQINNYE